MTAILTPSASLNLIIASDERTGRLRARTVDVEWVAQQALDRAIESGRPVVDVDHGGDVCNSYGYRASTEAVLVVAFPTGEVVAWAAQLAANKITYRGAAAACLHGAGPAYDRRVRPESRREARQAIVDEARRELASVCS